MCPPAKRFSGERGPPLALSSVGVRHSEDDNALALVARADFCRREQSSLNLETKLVKVSEYSLGASDFVRPRREHASNVLDDDEPDAGLNDDAASRGPEVSGVVASLLPTGEAVRLTRDATNEAVHRATPCAAVEGSGIRPHRSRMKETLFHR